MQKFQVGELAYIIESTIHITQIKILKYAGGHYTIQFPNGGIRVRENRLYKPKKKQSKLLLPQKSEIC